MVNINGIIFSGFPIFTGAAGSSPFGMKCLYPLSQTSAVDVLAGILSYLDPTGPAVPLFNQDLTTVVTSQEIVAKDGRVYHGWVMNKTAVEVLKLSKAAKNAIPDFKLPFLCIHGGEDDIALPIGSEHLFSFAGTEQNQKNIKIFPTAKHELLHEIDDVKKEAIDLCISFTEECLRSIKT
jgi:esterase/lipase